MSLLFSFLGCGWSWSFFLLAFGGRALITLGVGLGNGPILQSLVNQAGAGSLAPFSVGVLIGENRLGSPPYRFEITGGGMIPVIALLASSSSVCSSLEDSEGGLSTSDSELKFITLTWYSPTGLAGGVSGRLSASSSFCSVSADVGLGSFASSSCRAVSTSWADVELLVEGVADEVSTSLAIVL